MKVFENLDHEGFYIPNEASFALLMSIYRYACQVYIVNALPSTKRGSCLLNVYMLRIHVYFMLTPEWEL